MKIKAAHRLQAASGWAALSVNATPCLSSVLTEADFQQVLESLGQGDLVVASTRIEALDLWKRVQDAGLTKKLMQFVSNFKAMCQKLSEELGLEISKIVEAFKTKPMFAFFKAIKFSLSVLLKPLKAFAAVYKAGILKIFAELHATSVFQKIHSGAMKVDELFNQYPLLKRLAGPAVAGLLLWMWLSGNFTAEPSMDMDLTAMMNAALHGQWSAAELFTSKEGLAAIGLLITGLLTPWPSPVWLNEALPFNLLVALCYTAFKHLQGENPTVQKIRKHIKWGRV